MKALQKNERLYFIKKMKEKGQNIGDYDFIYFGKKILLNQVC